MYSPDSPSSKKAHGDPAAHITQPSAYEGISYSVPPQKEDNQVVPDQYKDVEEKRRERLRTWSYHCRVTELQVNMNKQGKLTENYKSLSAEEMRLLDEDIFNPLDICLIISKNSKETAN